MCTVILVLLLIFLTSLHPYLQLSDEELEHLSDNMDFSVASNFQVIFFFLFSLTGSVTQWPVVSNSDFFSLFCISIANQLPQEATLEKKVGYTHFFFFFFSQK